MGTCYAVTDTRATSHVVMRFVAHINDRTLDLADSHSREPGSAVTSQDVHAPSMAVIDHASADQ
eukprot:5335197-Prymnesium_polylepis.1